MTSIAFAPASFSAGSVATAADAATLVRRKLDALTRQTGDGLKSETFGGLGSGAAAALSLNAALGRVETWQANADRIGGRLDAAQSALAQIGSIASDFFARTNDLNGLNAQSVDSVAAAARDALRQVAGLLDTSFGDVYVFAGSDSANPPVPDPDGILSGGFYTGINAAVANLAASGSAATAAATLAIASSNAAGTSPFSTQLSQPAAALAGERPVVQVGAGRFVPVGVLASANADIASLGGSTTGSYTRDIMRALATLGSLSSAQIPAAGFAGLVRDVHDSLGGAITALSSDSGVLGDRAKALTDTSQRLGDAAVALKDQIGNAQDVDMADTMTRLSAAQTQLQASYQLMSALRSLSLANFLG